jgi:hypothetical protein
LSTYFGFTLSERVDELQAVLDGQALAWYTGLSPGVKKDWTALKTKFLHQYGGGSSPAMAAIDELKKFRQDKMTIGGHHGSGTDLLSGSATGLLQGPDST